MTLRIDYAGDCFPWLSLDRLVKLSLVKIKSGLNNLSVGVSISEINGIGRIVLQRLDSIMLRELTWKTGSLLKPDILITTINNLGKPFYVQVYAEGRNSQLRWIELS